jgi:DNA-binding MarR family transcriptional regulator
MAGLAASAGMDIGAVSRQVRLLEDAGAVERSTDPTDGRVALLDLTADGRRMAEALRSTGVGHLDATIADWPEADVRQLATLLDKLVAEMVATPVPAPD